MNKPLVGLTAGLRSTSPDMKLSCRAAAVESSYLLSVLQAGGLPVAIPPLEEENDVAETVSRLDGLLVTGGCDVQPQLYGEEPGWGQGSFSPERDRLDLAAIRAAHAQGKPVFGICRGIQVINVCFGGTLYQDLRRESFCTVKHYQESESSQPSHTVEVGGESALRPILGASLLVNSFHHQAVKTPAPGFRVTAYARDGVAEMLESTSGPLVFAVQWHPEQMAADGDPVMCALFRFFVGECRRSAGGKNAFPGELPGAQTE